MNFLSMYIHGLTASIVLAKVSPKLECKDMATTRAFKSGNSQAIRIPADMAYADMSVELTVRRDGDVITIQPKRRDLREVVALLRQMPKLDIPEEPRDPIELPDRIWD
jgi:antitoxin VapB